MFKNLLVIVLVTINIAYAQNTLGTTTISEGVYDGYTLFTVSTETYLINNCGELVNQWSSAFPPGNAVYLLEDGSILRAGRTSSDFITFGGQGGVVEIYDWEGNLTWQFFYDTPLVRQHHDVFPMPNGNVLILAATRMSNAEAIEAGRNPDLLSESDLYNEQIIEVTPLGLNDATAVWEWNIKDHLIQDFDASKTNFGNVSLHAEKLDINFLNGGSSGSNWLHINSIQYNSTLDQIVLSARNLSEIYIIDHSTTTEEAASNSGGTYGKGGDFLYRWGNPQSYKQGNETDRKLYGQHYPYIIDSELPENHKIIVFNNGNGRTPLFSEVFIITLETESTGVYSYTAGTPFSPVQPEYIYKNESNPTDFFSGILSNAQVLPNNNILICEGINGRIFEVTATNEIVWEYIIPVNSNTGSLATQGDLPSSFANTTFRATKYPLDYEAFLFRTISPGNPIELEPNLTQCTTLNTISFESSSVSVYPNPTKGFIKFDSTNKIDKIEIYSGLGQKILETSHHPLDLSEQQNGLYLIRIHTKEGIITKKILKF